MATGLRLHTRQIEPADGAFVLDGSEGVLMLSYQMSNTSGDSAQLTGNIDFKASSDADAVPSEPVTIPAGGGNTFVSDANNKPITLSVTVLQGTLNLIIGL